MLAPKARHAPTVSARVPGVPRPRACEAVLNRVHLFRPCRCSHTGPKAKGTCSVSPPGDGAGAQVRQVTASFALTRVRLVSIICEHRARTWGRSRERDGGAAGKGPPLEQGAGSISAPTHKSRSGGLLPLSTASSLGQAGPQVAAPRWRPP